MGGGDEARPVVLGRGAGRARVEEEAVHAQTHRRLVRGEVDEDVAECVAVSSKGGFVATVGNAVGVHGVGVAGGGDDGVVVVGLADLGLGDGGPVPRAAPGIGDGGWRARGNDALGVGRRGGEKARLRRDGKGGGGGGGEGGGRKREEEAAREGGAYEGGNGGVGGLTL